ncbi:hypothetical protein pb186bvf_008153 [Paramecium bursaria]
MPYLLINTAFSNNNFLELNQPSYNLTIWIQLFTSLIDKQNQKFTLLDIKDDYQSHFTFQILMQNNDFQFVVNTPNTKERFGIDLINSNYQWIALALNSDECKINYHIWHPQTRNTFQDQSNCQKAKIITTFSEIATLLVYDEYQENLQNHYFIINEFPFFDKHQFQVQNDLNLTEIIAYARIVLEYEYNVYYIAQFSFKFSSVLLIYEGKDFYLGKISNKNFQQLLKYSYEIKNQVWLKYRISFQQQKLNIQLEIGEFNQKGTIDIGQQNYVNQIIYQLYNQRACLQCQGYLCLDQQQSIECSHVEFYNELTQKCELIVSLPFLSVTYETYTPRCKVGFYLENRQCIQCPSYQGFKCLECLINTNNWKEDRICTFSQIVYLQLISQLFQREGNIDYTIEDDHYSRNRRYKFLQNNEYQNIFQAQSKDIYLTYYDYTTNKKFCQIGYNYQNNKCIQNNFNCLFQQKQSCICKEGYTLIRYQCLRCQRFCKFCQFQNKALTCIIPEEKYQISNSAIKPCQNESETCSYPKVKCEMGQFYDIIEDKCFDKNLTYIQSNLVQFLQFLNITQGNGLYYLLSNQPIPPNSVTQLKFLSAFEQIHLLSSYTYKNQITILDCELTVYYRNIPYCLKAKQNYLVNNFNQLLYCPVSRYCGYKYIVDCKVQITNRAIIIINNQIYKNFSQIIESINKNIVEIQVVQFQVLFQINQQDIELDWSKIFYLEDEYFYQRNIKYALIIQFEQNQQFRNSDKIYIRFHHIILNNISLRDQGNNHNENFEISLIGSYLVMNSTNLFNLGKPLRINFKNYTSILIIDTKILNCTFVEQTLFIFDLNLQGIITIRNTVIQYSNLKAYLIKINGANQFKLVDFFITHSQLYQGIIFVPLSLKNFNILNIIFRYVYGFDAKLIALQIEAISGGLTAQDINFYNCDFHKTVIFQAKQSIIVEQLQFANTRFNQSCIIFSDRSQTVSISQFKLQNFTIINSYIVIIKYCRQVIIESLIMIYKLDSIFALFDIESVNCTFYNVRLNNFDNCFNRNMFILQRQQQVIISDLFIQGNFNSTSCFQDQSKKVKHLIQINSAQFVSLKNIKLQSSLFCDFGFIYVESEKLVIQFVEFRNLTLNLIYMQQSFMYFQSQILSSIHLDSITIDQIYIMIQVQHTFIHCLGFSSSIDVVNFQIQNVNTTFRGYILAVYNLFLILEQFYASNLRNMFILQSDNCDIVFNSSIIQKVLDYTNYSTPLFYITSNQYNLLFVEIFDIKVYDLQNQLIFIQPLSRQTLKMRDIQININLVKSDIIAFGTNKQKYQQLVQISNIILNIKNYNLKLEFYLLNITSKVIDISNITVNSLTSGFINALSISTNIKNITINNPVNQFTNIFLFNQSDIKIKYILCYNPHVLKQSKEIQLQQYKRSIYKIFINPSEAAVQNQYQRNIIRNSVFNNMSLQLNIIQVFGNFKINMQESHFIKTQTKQLFLGLKSQFNLIRSLIINSTSNLAQQTNNVYIQDSQLVDGQIILSNIKFNQTYILNKQSDANDKYQSQELQLFLSLNEGNSYFKNQIKDNLNFVLLSQQNQYLYLPSGQLLQQFKYLDVKYQTYQQLYESISIIVMYSKQDCTFNCLLEQQINGSHSNQIDIVLKFGVNIINNLTFTLNPYFNQSLQNTLTCNYDQDSSNLTFFVKTFPCQLGEYLFQHQCLVCDIEKNYYSVIYKATNCLIKDNQKIEQLKKGQIQLQFNYWRFQLHNKYIEKCSNNCMGGWKVGDNSCKEGHIGAICQECDIYNTRGQGQYGLDGDKCQICSFDYTLIIKGLLISLWQILLAYMSYSTNTQISNQFLFNKINNRRLSNILDRQNINQVSVMIKLFSNYLYALYVIKDNFYLGNYIDWSLNLFNNPNMIISPQLDCMLTQLTNFDVSYSMLIYRFATPFLVLNMFFIIFIISIFLKQSKYETKVYLYVQLVSYTLKLNQAFILQNIFEYSLGVLEFVKNVLF